MKKKLFIVLLIGVVIGIFVINNVYNNSYSSRSIIENSTASNAISNVSTLSMMLETRAASGVYEVSSDTSWPTSGYNYNSTLSKCTNGSTLTWDSDNATIVFSGTAADTCYVYFDLIPAIANVCDDGDNLSECIQELYTVSGEGTVGLYYFDGVGDYTNADQEYADYRYIYSGGTDDVNNFLCLGDDCTDTDNLYRILGIYLNDDNEYEVKVMKYEYSDSSYDVYYMTSFTSSDLYTYLNDTFISNIESYSNLIVTHTWHILGSVGYTYTPSSYVEYEKSSTDIFEDEVGLIYISDFGYASAYEKWSISMKDLGVTETTNWMYGGDYLEMALSFYLTGSGRTYRVFGGIDVGYGSYYVRPTFYLSSSVAYSSGSGKINDPIILVTE